MEGPLARLSQAKQSTSRLKTASTRKERRVAVIGSSLLRGTEGRAHQLDPTSREDCCLLGARVRDISGKLPDLIRPSDYYPLLLVQAGRDEVTEKSMRTMKKDFRGLARVVDGAGVQVVFSSVPSVARKDGKRIRKTHRINKWLRGRCKHKNLGFLFFFFDHGVIYLTSYKRQQLICMYVHGNSHRSRKNYAQFFPVGVFYQHLWSFTSACAMAVMKRWLTAGRQIQESVGKVWVPRGRHLTYRASQAGTEKGGL